MQAAFGGAGLRRVVMVGVFAQFEGNVAQQPCVQLMSYMHNRCPEMRALRALRASQGYVF